ncbi:hypothetical protein NNO03_03055, partial [Citrobacter sp. Igbk 16]|nr:hypothetical protein [Citrobacter sp. Igbk 16]
DKKSTCVNITYGADRPFLYGTGVSITSVLLNNRDLNFHFHIFFHIFFLLILSECTRVYVRQNGSPVGIE